MSRFRWRLFWTLALLNVLAVSAVLVITTRWPEGWSNASPTPSTNLDPVVEVVPTTAAAAATPTAESTPEAAQPARPPDATTVELWHSWSGSEGDALTNILSRFQQLRPDIRVQSHFVAYGDFAQAYTEAARARGGPDLIMAPGWWLRQLAAEDLLLPLDTWVPANERAQFIPATVENLTWRGRLYGLPTHYELVALYFNRRLLADDNLPATTDDIIDLAQASPSQGIGIYTNFYHLFWAIPAYGSALFDENGRVVLDKSTGTAQFLSWLLRAQETPGIFTALDYGMLMERFKKEEYALFIDGPWSIRELRERFGDDLGVAPLPDGPGGPARPWLGADGVFLNAAVPDERLEHALALARHITGADSASQLAQIAGRLPAHKDADLGGDALLTGFSFQADTALALPHHAEMDEVWGYAEEMIAQALDRAATPEEAVVQAATLINEANEK